MPNPFPLYREKSSGDDRFVLALLLLPLGLCLYRTFGGALPFWMLGACQGYFTYPWSTRHRRASTILLAGLFSLVILGNALLQADMLSNRWTLPIANGLLYSLAIPAGMHLHSVASRDP